MIKELESTVTIQQKKIEDLETRLLKTEQYSSRSTAIVTGLKEEANEDLEEVVTSQLKDSGALPANFTARDIAHVHRNRKKPNSDKPRSITLVFARSSDKDRVFQKSAKDNLYKKHGVKIHHHMCQALIEEQKKMEELEEVDWVSYFGHSAGFRVKLKNGDYLKKISHAADLMKQLADS